MSDPGRIAKCKDYSTLVPTVQPAAGCLAVHVWNWWTGLLDWNTGLEYWNGL